MTIRVFSNGGGVQSTAALVLSARGEIDFPVHLFANVGDDSENPGTLDYVRNISMPYAKSHGVELIEICRVTKAGVAETLMEFTVKPSRSIGIPVRLSSGAPGTRQCTSVFKLAPVRKYLKANGATKANPAQLGIGISLDEIHRAKRVDSDDIQIRSYPLLDLGLTRKDCHRIIAEAGLPQPPKSSC